MGLDEMSPPTASRPRGAGAVAIYGSYRYGQYFDDILTGVVTAANARGSSVVCVQNSLGVRPSSEESSAQDAVTRVGWDHFDSAIVVLQAASRDYVARLRDAGKFVVAIGPEPRGGQAVIALDNVRGVRDAIAHLAGHGHMAIGFLSPRWQIDTAERYAAYAAQMSDLGLEPRPLLGGDQSSDVTMDEQGYLAGREFVASRDRCTAVMVGTDLIALGFVRALTEAGVSVPGDVAVVGIDDIDQAAVSSPPLATVAFSFESLGALAFDVALDGSRGLRPPERHLVSPRFVARESCGCPSGSGAASGAATGSAAQTFAAALGTAAQEGRFRAAIDVGEVVQVASDVVAHLTQPPTAGGPARDAALTLAARIVRLCPLDRSVESALHALRAVVAAVVDDLPADPARLRATSAAALDLCDAVRSEQLQRRMREYVELKRAQRSHYVVGNALLGHDPQELRSLGWLRHTASDAGALGLWAPPGQSGTIRLAGVFERDPVTGDAPAAGLPAGPAGPPAVPVESFPPAELLVGPSGGARLVVVTHVRSADSDWGLLAAAGGDGIRSSLVHETFQQWAVLMSAALDLERADDDLARQAAALTQAYETEVALLEEVRISEERYAIAAEAAQDAVWDWDLGRDEVFYSSRWKAMLGHRDTEVGAGPGEWLERVHPEDAAGLRAQLDEVLAGARVHLDVEHRLRAANGDYRWVACIARTVTDEAGRPVRLVGSTTDITVSRLLKEQLLQEALFDGLTGLAKATLFRDRLTQALERVRRHPQARFAVLFVDLDGFKAVNDTFGHGVGDALLASVAVRLRESLRGNDTAARLGGDEFGVLLADVGDTEEQARVVDRIRARVTAPYRLGHREVRVGASIGVAVATPDATADSLIEAADAAMYREKHARRGAVGHGR
ncbi:MAG: diguanylate cyclase [Actinobacteria bacterium]|nr:diguanylate cyclase [Actinomycetota bacterium]